MSEGNSAGIGDSPAQPPSKAARGHSRGQSTVRYVMSLFLSVLAGASLLLASVGLWVNNTIFDSSRFSHIVEETLDEPEVNVALSRYLVTQVMDNLDVEQTTTQVLPDEIDGIAPLLTGAVRNIVEEGIQTVLADQRVQDLIGQQIEQSHAALMIVLEDRGPLGDAVTTDGNKVVLDLGEVLERALEDVERAGVLIDRLDLPEDFGKLVVYEGDAVESSSNALRAAQDVLSFFKRLLWVFIVATPVLVAGSIYVASSRQHSVRRLGILLAAVSAAVVLSLSTVVSAVGDMIADPEAGGAAETIVQAFTGRLRGFGWLMFWLSLIVIVGATFYNQIVAQYRKYRNASSANTSSESTTSI